MKKEIKIWIENNLENEQTIKLSEISRKFFESAFYKENYKKQGSLFERETLIFLASKDGLNCTYEQEDYPTILEYLLKDNEAELLIEKFNDSFTSDELYFKMDEYSDEFGSYAKVLELNLSDYELTMACLYELFTHDLDKYDDDEKNQISNDWNKLTPSQKEDGKTISQLIDKQVG